MGRIFLLCIALVVYGSLFPFHFHHGQSPAGPLLTFLYTWPGALDRFEIRDIAVNILIYIPIGLFGCLWVGNGEVRRAGAAWAILLGIGLSFTMEMLQFYDDMRSCSISDLLTNTAGTMLGTWLAHLYNRTVAKHVARHEVRHALRPSGALLLLLCWITHHIFPVFPQLSLSMLAVKAAALRAAAPTAVMVVETVGGLLDWLITARLLEGLLGTTENTPLLLAGLMLLVPAKLFILTRTFTWPELMGAAAALLVWTLWLRRYEKRTTLLAWLAAALLLARGLEPYQMRDVPLHFSWIPFAALFSADWGSAAVVFFRKAFLYGSAVWLFAEARYSAVKSLAGLTMLLGAIEAVQVYLPGRAPEISDPIYMLIVAAALKMLDAEDRRVRELATEPVG